MKLQAHKVTGGIAQGTVALSSAPISFLGEIDPSTGRVDNPASELNGKVISGQVLAFPEARGSTVGPYVLYGARKRGTGPCALVVHQADAIVASAAVIAKLPCVDQVDLDLLRPGEEVGVDGDQGLLDVPGLKEVPVVTVLLQDEQGKLLLLKRSEEVRTYRGRWAGVSGYVESGKTPRQQAEQEIEEELGVTVSKLRPLATSSPVYVREERDVFSVHPFLYRAPQGLPLRLDREHSEFAWVVPSEISRYETVPKLANVWRRLEASTPPPAVGS